MDGSFLETVIPADRGPRRAAGKIYFLVYLEYFVRVHKVILAAPLFIEVHVLSLGK